MKEQLEQRLRQLELEKISVISTYEGAIQDCKYWLENLEKVKTDVKNSPEQSS